MKKVEIKNDEVQFLKRNWNALRENAMAALNASADFVMASVEKDIDLVVDKANQTVLKINGWLKNQELRMHQSYVKKEEEIEKDLEVARMDSEGGSGFINTMPHETSPTETASASGVTGHRH
jgi:hypothetical protein